MLSNLPPAKDAAPDQRVNRTRPKGANVLCLHADAVIMSRTFGSAPGRRVSGGGSGFKALIQKVIHGAPLAFAGTPRRLRRKSLVQR